MIPDNKIAEIRERADIAEVVGDYVSLKRTGANLKGVCPFHADTDPSFSVNSARQFFHCFGCGASGDVFVFVQRIEGLSFTEAAKRLADRYSIEIPEQPLSAAARTQSERAREASQRRLWILEEATAFFESRLAAKDGEKARNLLSSRGIQSEIQKKYRLGFAPNSWQSLIDYFKTKNVSPKELFDVGLALARQGGGFYDRFRGRLIFTITNASGQPIAFSGRALEDGEDQGAKYINSPETIEYKKGNVLYGLHQARVSMSKEKEVVLVEGNFDVISLSQIGVENVVAPLGTAFTEEQTDLLRRRVENVIVMFDGDSAGRKATARAFPILAKAGLAGYAALLPDGEDPDSMARKRGAVAIKEAISKRRGLFDHIIESTAAAHDGTVQDIARKVEYLNVYLSALKTPIEADLYRRRIAAAFGIDSQTVFKYLRGGGSRENGRQSDSAPGSLPGRVEERELIGLFLDIPQLLENAMANETISSVSTPAMKKLLDEIVNRYRRKESSIGDLVSCADNIQISNWLAGRAMVRLYEDDEKAKRALFDIRSKLEGAEIKERINELENQIRLAAASGDDIRVLELSREKVSLQRKTRAKERKEDGYLTYT